MFVRSFQRWLAAGTGVALAVAIAACGGGGSSGGIGGTGIEPSVAYGTITNFGSVWVNGVEYSTTNTTFKTDDHPSGGGSQSELRVGMVVRVDGAVSARRADTITEDESLKGLVEQVIGTDQIVVLGQTVRIDPATAFEGGVRPGLTDRVEVHGQIAGDGVIAAGFIEKKTAAPTPPYALKGIVRSQDTAAQTLQIGTLVVQYAGATLSNMPLGSWVGLQVNVKGTSCGGVFPVCGTLVATKLEPAGASVSGISQAEIEGVVVTINADGFTIGNQRVVTTGSTRYEGGVASDIAVGTEVEAEGSISGGVLTATKVSFRDGTRLEGDIATVSGNTLTIAGLPGVTVTLTSFTERNGGSGALAAGDHVRVRGKAGPANLPNAIIATRLDLRSADTRVELQAAVQAASPESSVRLLGVDIATGVGLVYRDASGGPIDRTAFFAGATVGKLVKARGTLGAGGVTWSELELEN